MIPHFANDTNWQAYKAVLKSWLGTPYRHMQCCKGRGADCALFFAGCLRELGILEQVNYGYYPRDWHIHTHEELVLTSIYTNMDTHTRPGLKLIEMPLNEPLLHGDIICFAISHTGVTNHSAVMWDDGNFIHAGMDNGVIIQPLDERYKRRMSTFFRFFEIGEDK